MIKIRPYTHGDLDTLYHICLLTGNSGKDASASYKDPKLLGHFYVGPYTLLEPDLCFVLQFEGGPCGYILGTSDSIAFAKRSEMTWFPKLRERYTYPQPADTSNDARLIRLLYNGYIVKEEFYSYPAHLHIDILPQAQGRGMGRKLVQTFIGKLQRLNVPALHLEVGKSNTGAIRFYKRCGFTRIAEYEFSIGFGMNLSGPKGS